MLKSTFTPCICTRISQNYEWLPLVASDSLYRKQLLCTRTNDSSWKPSLTIRVRSETFAVCSVMLKNCIHPVRKHHIKIFFYQSSFAGSLLQSIPSVTSHTGARQLCFISVFTKFILSLISVGCYLFQSPSKILIEEPFL